MEGLVEGRIVHYVLEAFDSEASQGEHRPAIVVKVWNESGEVNLQVFMDGDGGDYNDGDHSPLRWVTSTSPDLDEKLPGTWHWIEPA